MEIFGAGLTHMVIKTLFDMSLFNCSLLRVAVGFCSNIFFFVFQMSVSSLYLSGHMALIILNGIGVVLEMSANIQSVPDKTKIIVL